jgi:hypothetical protein
MMDRAATAAAAAQKEYSRDFIELEVEAVSCARSGETKHESKFMPCMNET